MLQNIALLRLMNLVSPALPVGGFAYSQGLEWAIEEGGVNTPELIQTWLAELLEGSLTATEVPLLKRCLKAAVKKDYAGFSAWNDLCLASRETEELLAEDTAMGAALCKLLGNDRNCWQPETTPCSFVAAWALACAHWQIPERQAALGLLWSWCENQIAAASKTLPLAQTPAQAILQRLMPVIEKAVYEGLLLDDQDIGWSHPYWTMACSWHETQYSRLFRS